MMEGEMESESEADYQHFDDRTNTPINEKYGSLELLSGTDEDGRLYCEVNIDTHIEGRPPEPGSPLFLYELDRFIHEIYFTRDSLITSDDLS